MMEIKNCTDYEVAKKLFVEYSSLKGAEQCFVSFENELKKIDEIYPQGQILIGYEDNQPVGCIALKALDNENCELKRLYIKEQYREKGYSKLLFEAMLGRAKELGFKNAVIHTLPEVMNIGYNMYLRYGFVQNSALKDKAVELTRTI